MTQHKKLGLILAALTPCAMLSGGCDDTFRRAVRNGILSYISGGISQLNTGGVVTSLVNDLLTGSPFGGGIDTGTNTGGTGT